jgi:transposase
MNPQRLRREIDSAGGLLDVSGVADLLGVSRSAVRQRVRRAEARGWSGFARPIGGLPRGDDELSFPVWTVEQIEEQRDLDEAGRRGDEVGE